MTAKFIQLHVTLRLLLDPLLGLVKRFAPLSF